MSGPVARDGAGGATGGSAGSDMCDRGISPRPSVLRYARMDTWLALIYAWVVDVDWSTPLTQSNTTPTLQVVVNPMIMRGSPIHDAGARDHCWQASAHTPRSIVFNGLAALKAEHVRFVPWFPYPELVVAELDPPAGGMSARSDSFR